MAGLVPMLTEAGAEVEIETNGTIAPPPALARNGVSFNVSPKLANSGMPAARRIRGRRPPGPGQVRGTPGSSSWSPASPTWMRSPGCSDAYGLDPVWVMPEGTSSTAVLGGMRMLATRSSRGAGTCRPGCTCCCGRTPVAGSLTRPGRGRLFPPASPRVSGSGPVSCAGSVPAAQAAPRVPGCPPGMARGSRRPAARVPVAARNPSPDLVWTAAPVTVAAACGPRAGRAAPIRRCRSPAWTGGQRRRSLSRWAGGCPRARNGNGWPAAASAGTRGAMRSRPQCTRTCAASVPGTPRRLARSRPALPPTAWWTWPGTCGNRRLPACRAPGPWSAAARTTRSACTPRAGSPARSPPGPSPPASACAW